MSFETTNPFRFPRFRLFKVVRIKLALKSPQQVKHELQRTHDFFSQSGTFLNAISRVTNETN